MRYRKRNFKGFIINLRKIKSTVFAAFVFAFYLIIILNLNIPFISFDFLNYCLTDNFKMIDNKLIDLENFLGGKALITKALPYINYEMDVKSEKNLAESEKEETKAIEKTENEKIVSKNLSVKNETNYTVDVQSILSEKPSFKLSKTEPLVLIVHTHASESFTSNGEFETMDTDRTLDTRYNMIRIGEEFYQILSKSGINVIHDKTIHDYPSYTSSYKRTDETIEMYLEKYPSIEIVLDIHRDALIKEDGTKIKLSTNINGLDTAQVMILCGSNEGGLEFDTWEDNLRLAMQIQKTMEEDYPTLARPITLSKNRYNMHKTRGSLLFEIGTNGNTLDEAIRGANLMAQSVSKTLLSLVQ